MLTEHQPAYILHTRPYRDTSLLIDFITPEYGRFSAVARGVRARKTPKRNLLNPFTRLLISFQGKTDLKTLISFEPSAASVALTEKHLYSGFYLNELLVRLLPELDPHPDVFDFYEKSIGELSERVALEPVLREFELSLLASLGYAINFEVDSRSHLPITHDEFYCLDVQQGFFKADQFIPDNMKIMGQHILAIAHQHYQQAEVKRAAKQITRQLLKPLLGAKPLNSRELFF
jgi:DNA repair protein RecO (recombination protein O)